MATNSINYRFTADSSTYSKEMSSALFQRINYGNSLLNVIADRMSITNGQIYRNTTFDNMIFSEIGNAPLNFAQANFKQEEITVDTPWETTREWYQRNAPVIGGAAQLDEDTKQGRRAGDLIMSTFTQKAMNTLVSASGISEFKSGTTALTKENVIDFFQDATISMETRLTNGVSEGMRYTLLLPIRAKKPIANALIGRDTTLGDSQVVGGLETYKNFSGIQVAYTKDLPFETTLAFTTRPADGDELELNPDETGLKVKFVATIADKSIPNQIKRGADAAGDLANLIGFLTNSKNDGSNDDYTIRVMRDPFSAANSNNAHTRNVLFSVVDASAGTIRVSGLTTLDPTAGDGNSVVMTATAPVFEAVVFSGKPVEYFIGQDIKYTKWHTDTNSSIWREQYDGLYKMDMWDDKKLRVKKAKVTVA